MKQNKKKAPKEKPDVNPELEGLDITINTFGEIQSTLGIEDINEFLNDHLEDKKLNKKPRRQENSDESEK